MIIHWKNETIPDNVVHIQGTDDRVLPCKVNVSYQYLIKKGTHVMVLAHAAEISKILNKELEVIKF